MDDRIKITCTKEWIDKLNAYCRENHHLRNHFVITAVNFYIEQEEEEKIFWEKELEARRKQRIEEKIKLKEIWEKNMKEKELHEAVRDWKSEEFEQRIRKRVEEYEKKYQKECPDYIREDIEFEESNYD